MVEYLGSRDGLALFSNGELSAIIDTNLNMVVEFGALSNLRDRSWDMSVPSSDTSLELAVAALVEIENSLTASAGRMYTIPDGVKNEAVKALKWRKEHKRGGTPVGLNTARTLARGGQIGINKVRHIAKYFPRHEVDKKGKGWEPGEDNFPSNGRIAWALWGGDAAWRWASAIVERENKNKSVAAGGYMLPGYEDHMDMYEDSYDSDINAFKAAYDLDANYGPEFLVRVRLDGSGIDRLYKIDIDGHVFVWDDCSWDDLGHVDGDIYTYDLSLDDPYDQTEKTHVLIDPDSAVVVSAMLQEGPFKNVQIEDIDASEAAMFMGALADLDMEMLDRVMVAAGAPEATDGEYTEEERAQKAAKQPRDASGQFAKAGSRVVVGGDMRNGLGVITKVDNNNGKVDVKLDNGQMISVDAKMTKAFDERMQAEAARAAAQAAAPKPAPKPNVKPLSTKGILGEPKKQTNTAKATLDNGPDPLGKAELDEFFTDWTNAVTAARKNRAVTAAVETEEEDLTPQTTDVAPKYLAIVSPDDPQAVMDVVAIVPKTATSVEPLVYRRKDKKWIPDDQTLKDLKSATPPPVVVLDTKELIDNILKQVDGVMNVASSDEEPVAASAIYQHVINFWYGSTEAMIAAGGLDRNRGNAEELRQYWTKGKGAAKIRWGQPGDWKRCVKYLAKHLGPRAKGYCQLRHKEALGIYTATHAKRERNRG
jgi:hypothetical protein